MNTIQFSASIITWTNNSSANIDWINSNLSGIAWNTNSTSNSIAVADFMRVTTVVGSTTTVYLFSTAPYAMTIPLVDSSPFSGLGVLVKVGDAQRDIKSTANETTVTLVGLDTSLLGWVLGQNIKGSKIELWHGFFDETGSLITSGGVGGLYKFFTGYVNSFTISEQWMEEIRQFVGTIGVSASSIQIILQNRTAGRYTNNSAWTFFNAGDTSMLRVPFIETINYQFGKDAPPNS